METLSSIRFLPDGASLRLRRWILVVQAGPDRGMERVLGADPLVIGRVPEGGLALADPKVSRRHARIEIEEGGVRIVDLGSKGGTRVAGVDVESARVAPGQEVTLGDTVLVFEVDDLEVRADRPEAKEFEGMLGGSRAMRDLFGLVEKVAPLDLPVLLFGETGTGKEGLARALHRRGARPDGPLVTVDCTLLTDPTQARSELFGHEKGAFTGAETRREGAFVRADGGTLFLDEVGELPPEVQAQLLRVLQEGEVSPLGGERVDRVDVRVLSATHRDLRARIANGEFRQDLYYRLAAVVLEVPPLREREGDLDLLVGRVLGGEVALARGVRDELHRYAWPGNVRELLFALERGKAMARGGMIHLEDLGLGSPVASPDASAPRREFVARPGDLDPSSARRKAFDQEDEIRQALRTCGGNRAEAARMLGISRATLYRRLKELKDRED